MNMLSFEESGKIVIPPTEELEKADEQTAILAYISGSLDGGMSYYAYIAVKPSKYLEFYSLTQQRKPIDDLLDYGVIVSEGFEYEPSAEVVKEMQELYGFNDKWEDQLKLQLEQQRSAFCDKREDDRLQDIIKTMKAKK